MELDPVLLSRLQFGFVISFHIIFPAFTIGVAAWLAMIEGARLATGNALQRCVFDFRLTVFAVSFGMGVATGIVMALLRLGLMFWPSMIPYSVAVADAAAPDASLRFLYYGGVVVLPVIAAQTIGVFWVFRGKLGKVTSKP